MNLTISHSLPTTTLVSGDQGLICVVSTVEQAFLVFFLYLCLPPSPVLYTYYVSIVGQACLHVVPHIPPYFVSCHHCHPPAGVAGFVVNDKEEVLLVQEKWLRRLSIRHWKLPGGHSERGTGTVASLTRM